MIGMRYRTRKQMLRSNRRGLLMTELIVAAVLLITSLSLLTTLSIRTGKLWQDSRHYALAVDELTNQLERLTSLDVAGLDEQLLKLTPSPAIQNVGMPAVLSIATKIGATTRNDNPVKRISGRKRSTSLAMIHIAIPCRP